MLLTELPQNFVLANVIKKIVICYWNTFLYLWEDLFSGAQSQPLLVLPETLGGPAPRPLCLWGSARTVKIQRGSLSSLALTQPICFKRGEPSQRCPGWHSLGASGFAPGLVEGQLGLKVACSCHCFYLLLSHTNFKIWIPFIKKGRTLRHKEGQDVKRPYSLIFQ